LVVLKDKGVVVDCPICVESRDANGIFICVSTPRGCQPNNGCCKQTRGTLNCANNCGANDNCYQRPRTNDVPAGAATSVCTFNGGSTERDCTRVFQAFLAGTATAAAVSGCLANGP
jgi:hypothetical protein